MKVPKRFGLARVISRLGYCSRSQATALILEKRVTVNGRLVQNPESSVRYPQDKIAVDGAVLKKQPAIYLAMNKPRGVVTTASDEKGRATVYDLLPADRPGDERRDAAWVAPVGRLDKASEGLLLLTNDSEWAARISDPASHLDKVYHVQVDYVVGPEVLARLIEGREDRGEHLHAKTARLLRHGDKNSWLEITLDEGRNRQIRRLLEALGFRVLRLVRVSIGPLQLGDLKKGAVRPLLRREKLAIDQALARAK